MCAGEGWGLDQAKGFEFGSSMVVYACGVSTERLRRKDHEIEDSLGHRARACLKGKQHKPCKVLVTFNKLLLCAVCSEASES